MCLNCRPGLLGLARQLGVHMRAKVFVVIALAGCGLAPVATGACPVEPAARLAPPSSAPVTETFRMQQHPLLNVETMHTGWDYGAPPGASVYASAAGRVVRAGYEGGYGQLVIVDHGDGLETAYAHLRRTRVAEGDCVAQGAVVGEVGSTGLAAEPHLHFEVRTHGVSVDPSRWLKARQAVHPDRRWRTPNAS